MARETALTRTAMVPTGRSDRELRMVSGALRPSQALVC
jgi:hypothetical protein